MPDPFITTDDLTDILGRDVHSSGGTIAVDAACDTVRTLTGQAINFGTSTSVFDGNGVDSLVLPQYPAGSVSAVETRSASTWNTAGAADYTLSDNGVLIATNSGGTATFGTIWPMGRQNIRVTYTHGYLPDDVPRDIRMVALSMAERLVLQGPMTSESSAGVSVSYASPQLDPTTGEKAILAKYRRTHSS